MAISPGQIAHYNEFGYVVVAGLFDAKTVGQMADHFMAMRAEGAKPGDYGGTKDQPEDANHAYPRMINMHNWDALTETWSAHEGVLTAAQLLMGDEPVLRQTMLYFKPPKSRGQALHQDEQYITIDPLIGVWVPLDRSDFEVGQMVVVPKSHQNGIYAVEAADTSVSFTPAQSSLPQGAQVLGLDMNPGDVLFFHGRTIHGSYANVTSDRWRRTFICHYVGKHAQKFEPVEGTHVSHVKS